MVLKRLEIHDRIIIDIFLIELTQFEKTEPKGIVFNPLGNADKLFNEMLRNLLRESVECSKKRYHISQKN